MNLLQKAKGFLAECDAVFFNTQDSFLSEFTKPENNDVFQVTGFSGSNGYVLLTETKSMLLTDGRYIIQAKQELPSFFEVRDISLFYKILKKEGIASLALNYGRVSAEFIKKLYREVPQLQLIHLNEDFSKPFKSNGYFYEIETGNTRKEKLDEIAKYLKEKDKNSFFIADAQTTCWVLNIRGNDEQFTPVYKSTLLVKNDSTYELNPDLSKINGKIFIDFQSTFLQYNSIPAEKELSDFLTCNKAVKNDVEMKGIVNAHKIDGKILTKFLQWLECNYEGKTEWYIAQKLWEYRKAHNAFKMPSFATICGVNSNAAIIHYNPKKETAKIATSGSVLLLDSGGQFCGKDILGTTDVTRTLFLGSNALPNEYKKAFTLVLKGHIAVARAVFTHKTPASAFDAMARKYLKEANMDYPHSTGHGVGAFLSVHEAGCGISSRITKPLQEGMVLSNEPGYYLEGSFGIRIENLLVVKNGQEGNLFFETITFVPIQEKSVDFNLLTEEEKQWLKSYNQKCIENLSNNL